MIDAENRLVSDRMAWLTTLQGLLFAALAFLWDKPAVDVVMQVLCVVGILMSAIVWSTLVTASKAQRGLLIYHFVKLSRAAVVWAALARSRRALILARRVAKSAAVKIWPPQ